MFRLAYLIFLGLVVTCIYFAVHVVAQMLRDASAQPAPAESGLMKYVGPAVFLGLMWRSILFSKDTCPENKKVLCAGCS